MFNAAGRRRQERESLFSIGQTLRIRKGPLKGYLCRVVRMYRNDITVKLDSLVKILTGL
jgi:transcription elongation factor